MGSNTIYLVSDGNPSAEDDLNQYATAISGDFMPRNASSLAIETDQHSLGSVATQWKNTYTQNLVIDGVLFDPDNVGSGSDSSNAIVSGRTRADSGQPDFIRASGSGASMTILATETPLQITANSTSVTISADIAVTSLTTAPATNNTALVNDTALAGGASTKYTGEHESDPITIDTVGTEISSRIGQYICLKTSTEYMLAFVESATTLRHVYRGFLFDSSGNPLVRVALSNNDTLTIMSLGWVFMDANGTTVDVSYTSPIYSAVQPTSPVTDDYWFDLVNRLWKRYDGADYQTVSRMLIGVVVIDGTNCVASRSFDFSKSYSNLIEIEVEIERNTVVRSSTHRSAISVYGQKIDFGYGLVKFDITTDLESGLTEASDTLYYLYVTESGATKIATERPYDRLGDLQGFYHPYHSWRYVGVVYNNSGSNFSTANSVNTDSVKMDTFTSASGEWLAIPNKKAKMTVVAGGGGGAGLTGSGVGNGSSGGSSSVGSLISSTGGTGGTSTGGTGGNGTGGDINFFGGDGGNPYSTAISGGGGDSFYSGVTLSRTSGSVAGSAGKDKGGGGGGALNAGTGAAGGGGGGGCAIGVFSALSGRFAVTVGSGGSGGSGTYAGGSGQEGIITVEYL